MNKLYYILPILAGILFGTSGSFIRVLAKADFNTVTIVAQRASFAVVILAIVLFFYDRSLLRIRLKDLWLFALAGVCGINIMNLCLTVSMQELTMSFAAVLLSIFPMFVFILSAILFKERVTKLKVICSVLAVLGCYMVSEMPGILSTLTFSGRGLFLGILTPIFYSFYSIASRVAVDRGYQALTITFYSILFMALASIPFADWTVIGEYAVSGTPAAHIAILLEHALCVAVLPYMLFTIGIQHIDVGKAAILSSSEPAAAMLFGALFFHEIPSIVAVGGLIVASIAIALICMPETETPTVRRKT